MDYKKHYKLYKAGKKWCCAAILSATLFLGTSLLANNAYADSTTTGDTAVTTAQVAPQNNGDSKTAAANDQTAAAAVNNGTQNNNQANLASRPAAQNQSVQSTTVKTAAQQTAQAANTQASVQQVKASQSQQATGQTKLAATTASQVPATSQANSFSTINGKVYYYGQDGKLVQNQWYTNWGNKYYFGSDGARYTDVHAAVPSNSTDEYYFDSQGVMATDTFQTRNGKVYYYGNDGKEYKNRFYTNWGHHYYFGSDGSRWDNSFMVNWGHAYYFDNNGVLLTSQSRTINGTSYNFDQDGIITNDQNSFFTDHDGKVYYFDNNGHEYQNQFYTNWGNTYYFGSDGSRWDNSFMVRWGHAYYFGNDGALLTSQSKKISNTSYNFDKNGIITNIKDQVITDHDGNSYYFDNNGQLAKNQFVNKDGRQYYFGNDGRRWDNSFMVRWGHAYYFGNDGALLTSQTATVSGTSYTFDKDGVITNPQNKFFTDHDGKVYYFDNNGHEYQNQFYTNWGHHYYFGNDGSRWDNSFMVRWGHAYYFDNDGSSLTSQTRSIDGTSYAFNSQGVITNLRNQFIVDHDGKVYYFDNNGHEYISQYYKNWGHTYYFGGDGARYTNQWDVNHNYYFGSDGAAVTGLQHLDNHVYYADSQGVIQKSKTITVNGKNYSFDSQGQLQGGLTTQDGKQYYLDPETGEYRKNFLYSDGTNSIYFDKDTGAGTNTLQLQFDEGIVTPDAQYAKGNEAKSYDSKSIENVDGFLTADTWYQPKQILKDGTTWVNNDDNAYRPLLMTWWPNRKVQADYLNFMEKHQLLNSKVTFTLNTNPYELGANAQLVQQNIEKQISAKKGTDWLRTMMKWFVGGESIWNKNSESENYGGLQLQGGFLKYGNSSLTPWANSNWRLLGRQPVNIDGKGAKGSEFLLANDVDNSNPVVQAEQLNWLHYLMNFGTITAKDSDANFDGIRVDAVDNVDADLLNIASDYFKAVYGVDKSDAAANKHISILEDWGGGDPSYVKSIGAPQLTLDNNFSSIRDALGLGNKSMKEIITNSLVDRTADSTENVADPNYLFARAHDNGSQDEIRQAIAAVTNTPYGKFNFAQEQQGIKAYIDDQNQTTKKWNIYNIPAQYAIILTDKDTVPRVYYGDLYTDGGQYMAQQTRYYPTLTNMLKTRVKYVSGGQTMSVDQHNILTSVRFGKGAMKVTDAGNAETRTEGIGVIVSNNEHLSLKNGDSVVLHMGAAHKNQKYRAVVLTTDNGVLNYDSDTNAPVAYTDANGDLRFTNQNINGQAYTAVKGYANPDVRGYLAIWVPAGAPAGQDARTAASTAQNDGKQVFHSNAALDSNVIFEGFSNFVYWPTKDSERANVKIAQNADLFKQLGITSFELAPQYNSSKDGTFLDSQIDNGYAFTDRYDLGMSTPNKYGSADDLRNAIKSLHKAGIQAIADWVPDQIYNLPGKEVVSATRADEFGNTWESSTIKNTLYVANTIGGGKYQEEYGGAFLDELKAKYPQLFEKKQVSTGVPMDPSVKIKQWSAKYFNGTNILHRGSDYVLRGDDRNYFTLNGKVYLPTALTGETSAKNTGFVKDSNGNYKYYTPYGQLVTSSFVEDNTGNWYYFDKDGNMLRNTGFTDITVDGTTNTYLFLNDGRSFRSGLVQTADGTYYFDGDGHLVKGKTVTDGAMTYVLDADGKLTSESYNSTTTSAHPLKPGDLDPVTKKA